ncbi:MAG: DUF2339 domain-containing protein [Acidobacteriota bacterium]|nr:DUF2339 domain-containing protein [Acidobacteriota bacterium]
MEGCALFIVFLVAIGALIMALSAFFKFRSAQGDIKLLATELAVLKRVVAEGRRGLPVDAPPPPVEEQVAVAPLIVTPPEPEWRPVDAPPIEPVILSPTEVPPIEAAPPEEAPYIPPPPPPPPRPAKPAFAFDWENLVGVKLFSWIAGIALVLAAVFFLKYSVEHGFLSPTVRATLGILTGTALLVICELRVARGYAFTANAMHGAGIAILYATLFAMHALWQLVPAGVVFFLMLVVTAVAVGLSIRRDSIFIALLGLMGGFATPALLSSGQNRPIGLFSYLLLLNAGLAWVAYRKRWPALTVGSLLFTVFYQWGWVSKYLTPSQLPLAVTIFIVFAAMAAAALWVGRRDDAQSGQSIFDRVSLAAAALPLTFGIFAAAVPAYGARYHTLFGFLLLVATGLAFIAVIRRQAWLHAIGGGAVLLTFAIWSAVSYVPEAWPAILGWIAAFIALYLIISTRLQTFANLAAPLLFFMLPALVVLEPRAASPALLFGAFFVLLGAIAFVAIRSSHAYLYFVATFFVIVAEGIWSARHLEPERLYAALALYGAFGLLFVAVPAIAKRVGRALTPYAVTAVTVLVSLPMLLFVAAQESLAFPAWPLFGVLAILTLAIGITSLYLRRGSLTIGGAAGAQIVLLTWSAHTLLPDWGSVGLAATLIVAAWAYVWLFLAERLSELDTTMSFRIAAAVALFLGHIVATAVRASAEPALSMTLVLGTHLILAVAALALAWRTEMHALALWSVGLTSFATLTAANSLTPERAFVFALLPYALYVFYPALLAARVKRSLHPYLAAIVASATFFYFARNAMTGMKLDFMIGVLPVAQAIVLLLLLVRLLRIEPAGARDLTRLAMVAGTALAFITVAIPLQLDKQWITIGWALEGAALVWLFTRIPHRGLVAWAGALLAAVFVRLALNPDVFGYHPPGNRAIFNWYLYTYLVAAAAFFAAAYWLPRAWKRSIGAASAAGTILLFVLLNIEIADFYSIGPALTFNFFSSSLAQELTYTMGWAVFAIAMLIAGIMLHARAARVAALVLLLVTILKCFLHDLARLGGLYRVGSLLGLAFALVIVGVLLQKFVIVKSTPPATEEPA